MQLGIKQKTLAVLVSSLALTAVLHALLAWYFTDRQNRDAAFAALEHDLLTWQNDLQETTLQLRERALTAVNDAVVLNQIVELATLELSLAGRNQATDIADTARTLGYVKSVSLSRLQVVLRTGGFSSIAVRTRGALSHYVSTSDAGMSVPASGRPVWLTASVDAAGNLPLQTWRSWREASPREDVNRPLPDASAPAVSFEVLPPHSTVIQIAVPVEGVVDDVLVDWENRATARFVSNVGIARAPGTGTSASTPGRSTFAVVVFRRVLDRAALAKVARETRNWPALFSPDGRSQQHLVNLGLRPLELLETRSSQEAGLFHGIVPTSQGSSYVAVRRWEFEGQPRLILALAVSRQRTLHNVTQTVSAILVASAGILLVSIVVGAFGVGRLLNPILALTAAVKQRTPREARPDLPDGGRPGALARLDPMAIDAPGEIGDLARAFDTLLAELQRSFETLEQRVLARTAELRQQTQYLRTLIDLLPMRVWLKDTHSRYLAANRAVADACQVETVDELVGKADIDVNPPDLADTYRSDDLEVMRTRQRRTIEERGNATGTIWIETYKAPVVDDDGTVLGTVGIARDISDRKAAEAAHEAALNEAKRLAKLRTDFLAHMSHELRTPLNGILGYTQILQRDSTLDERHVARLNVIHQSGEHLLTLIDDLLDFAKIDSGTLQLSPGIVALDRFLRTIAGIISVKAEQKGLAFVLEPAAELPPAIDVDERRLREVLFNLLENAVRFTDRGQVALRVGAPGADRLRFDVQDTGIGIAPHDLDAIFRPFEQVGDARRRAGGTGLGLTISRQLVRMMGSDIQVTSQPGEGSTFSFELALPFLDIEGSGPADAVITGYEGERKRILIVDDDETSRTLLRDLLRQCGFETFEAVNGRDALGTANEIRPDVIVMDVVLPDIGGLDVTAEVRQLPEHAALPIVVVSASASSADEQISLARGASAFLSKPLDLDRFLETIARLLPVTWIYDVSTRKAPPSGDVTAALVVPPSEDLEALYHLARLGNMRDIASWATRLSERDPRYRSFAGRLRSLATTYQSKAILSFVEQYRKGKGSHDSSDTRTARPHDPDR